MGSAAGGLLPAAMLPAGLLPAGLLPAEGAQARAGGAPEREAIAREVREEFSHAWGGYKRFAFGADEVRPVSGGASHFFFRDRSVGLSIVEALDTLYVMGLDDELRLGVDWIVRHLDFDIDADGFGIFEGIIRLVGGLLAGYLAVGETRLLQLARELADRILPAFTTSPTGIPYARINLATGVPSQPDIALAEAGSNLLEFGTLSRLTGDPRYRGAAKRALRAVFERRSALDLLGTTINAETGTWSDPADPSINPPTDSFYEYLWGGHALLGDADCLRWYRTLKAALDRHAVETVGGLAWYKQVDFRTGAVIGRTQSELASFWAELVSAGGDRALGARYYRSWTAVLDRCAVLPEEIDFTNLAVVSAGNRFRPEYANAAFDLYWQTGDAFYAETAYRYFTGLREHARTANGYTVLDDVTTTPMRQGDLFPAYGFAENFKYLWLIFARTKRFDTRTFFLSTEGKVLRGLRRDPELRM